MSEQTKFEIHKIKRVQYIYDESQVNLFIKEGWILLSAGFTSGDGESEPTCILGHYEESDPEDDFDRFIASNPRRQRNLTQE